MLITKKLKFNISGIINFLICLLPLGLILGNSITNFLVILIGLLGIINYKTKIFVIENKTFQYLMYFFFFYLILITFINNWNFVSQDVIKKTNLIKSIFFLRFLVLFLVINKLSEFNELKIKNILVSFAFFSFAVGLDIIIQYTFGKNLLGYPLLYGVRANSFFGDELIAGGFLQRFSLFFIFFIPIITANKKYVNLTIISLFVIFTTAILVTLNRMPLIMFLFSIVLYFLLEKKIKEILYVFVIIFLIMVTFINFSSNKRIQINSKKFVKEITFFVSHAPNLFIHNKNNTDQEIYSDYLILFNSGVQLWKENKLFGQGIKSFRVNCKQAKYEMCGSHPHNYLIELMVDVGIVGSVLWYLIIILSVINFFKSYIKENDLNLKLAFSPFFLLIFTEFFPFRSSGSFFSTSNSAFIFLILAIFLNLNKIKKLLKL